MSGVSIQIHTRRRWHRIPLFLLRHVGSLWLAGIVLMLLLVSMAYATVFESLHGTERALWSFYGAWWFEALLALLGLNVLAAMVLRFPFHRHHVGFVLTHTGIVVTLIGAWMTKEYALDGQLGLAEGQSAGAFTLRDAEAITVANLATGARTTETLDRSMAGGPEQRTADTPQAIDAGSVLLHVRRYLPDGEPIENVANDNPHPQTAVELVISADATESAAWVWSHRDAALGPWTASLRVATSDDELRQWLAAPAESTHGGGAVNVVYQGTGHRLALSECLRQPAAIGQSPYTVRALRYFPHATVGQDGVVNASSKPVNPAVEIELAGPSGVERKWVFANFPDFNASHGDTKSPELKIALEAPTSSVSAADIEILTGPGDAAFVGFATADGDKPARRIETGQPVETPWPGATLTLRSRFDRARVTQEVRAIEPPREARVPALLVDLVAGDETAPMWIHKHRPARATVNGVPFELTYADREVALGYQVTLNRFRVGHYPGGAKPRSFESQVTIKEAGKVDGEDRVISMNHPTSHGGFTLYQSSYRVEGGRSVSILSVARDPGQPVVFAGYITTIVGMTVVLVTRRRQHAATAAGIGIELAGATRVALSCVQTDRPIHGAGTNRRGRAARPAAEPVSPENERISRT
ncbi:MAG: hypothetical protein HOP29_15610 [Phycisphaerales bacterium]|nr:hypothetical protein [Phycisphaerales bacterium]